jgi:hypothetical protein
MADYKVSLGAEVRTKEIDKQVNEYKGDINVGAILDTSNIAKTLASYKSAPLNVNTKLSTTGLTKAIQKYKAKKNITVSVEPDFDGIETAIKDKSFNTKLNVGVNLTWAGVAGQIKDFASTNEGKAAVLNVNAKLDENAISGAINKFNEEIDKAESNSIAKIRVNVDPNFDGVDSKIGKYSPSNSINAKVKILKKELIADLKAFQNEDTNNFIFLKGRFVDNAVQNALNEYKAKFPNRVKFPVDLELGDSTQITNKLNEYKEKGIEVQATLKPAAKGFKDKISNVKVDVTAELVNAQSIHDTVQGYIDSPVPVTAKLIPAKNFASEITKQKIPVEAELAPDAINNAIANPSKPFNKVSLDVQLTPKDINSINTQVKQLKPLVTEKLDVDVKLNEESVNTAITDLHPTAKLGVKTDLNFEDVDKQIKAYIPKEKVRVNLQIENGEIDEATGRQKAQEPINVNIKFDRENINTQIREFKTTTKIKVGVKLDFASHEGGQVGVPQQIRNYKTKSKIRVGVQLDGNDINKTIQDFRTDTPIRLGVELNPDGVQNVQNQIDNLRQQIQDLGNIRINLGGNNGAGGGNNGGGAGGNGNGGNRNGGNAREINDVTRAYRELISLQNRIGSKQQKVLNLDARQDQRQILSLSSTIDDLIRRYQRIRQLFDGQFDDIQVDNLNRGFQRTSENLDAISAKAADARAELARSVSIRLEDGSFDKQIVRVENGIRGLVNVSGDVQRELDNVRIAFRELENAYANDNIDALIAANERYEASLKAVKNQLDINKTSNTRDRQAFNILGNLINYDFDNQVNKINSDFNKLSVQSDDTRIAVNQLNQALVDMETAADSGDIDGLISANERYVESLKTARNQIAMQQRSEKDAAATYKNDIKELEAVASKIDKIKVRLANLSGKQFSSSEIKGLTTELQDLETAYQELYTKLQGNIPADKLSSITQNAIETANKIKYIKQELATQINIKLGTDGFQRELTNVESRFSSLKTESSEARAAFDNFKLALEKVKAAASMGDNGIDELIKANKEYELALIAVNNLLGIYETKQKDAAAAARAAAADKKLEEDKAIFSSQIDAWLTRNSAAAKQFGGRMKEIQAALKSADQEKFDSLVAEFKKLDKEAEAAGKKMQTFGDRFKAQWTKYSTYFSVASLIMRAGQAMRSMFEQVKLVDSAMTELKKVTNETDEAYSKFLKNSASKAREIGTTIDGLAKSTADFARLGYGFEDAQGLAEVANIYAVVGDEIDGVEQATESLISTMAAFQDEMNGMSNSDFAMSIVDKFNEIGNSFAISSGGIGEALERSASSMMAANNSLDETIALITAANTVVQDPEAVGRFMPTIKMAISVKILRRTRPRKDFISIFNTH